MQNRIVQRYTIKEIFGDHWGDFLDAMEEEGKEIRDIVSDEVEKMISCQDIKKGFALYTCPKCHKSKHIPFTCKSRFCNSCGAKYAKDRALNMSAKLIKGIHRHVVFTIPRELRKYFAYNRNLLNLLFEAAANTIFFNLARPTSLKTISPE